MRRAKSGRYPLEFQLTRATVPISRKIRIKGAGVGYIMEVSETKEGMYLLKVVVYTSDVQETVFNLDDRFISKTIN